MQSLHRKYGVSVSAISARAKKDGWSSVAKQIKEKTEQKVIEKISENISEDITNVEKTYIDSVKMAVNSIYAGILGCSPDDPKSLRAYVAALKDIKEMGVIQIDDNSGNEIKVVLDEELKQYAQ